MEMKKTMEWPLMFSSVLDLKNIGCLAAWHPGSGRYNPTPSQ